MLDFVNPIRAGRRLVGWGWEAGFDEDRPVSGQALRHTLDQHAANLGGCGEESNRNEIPARRIDRVAQPRPPVSHLGDLGMLIRARKVQPSPLWKPQPPWLIFAWWLGPPLAVLLAVLWLWKMLAPLMFSS